MSTDLQFLPDSHDLGRGGRPPKYMTASVRERLANNPGRWAHLTEYSSDSARSAVVAWCRRHEGFQSTSRSKGVDENGRRLFDIHVRYVPPNEDPAVIAWRESLTTTPQGEGE